MPIPLISSIEPKNEGLFPTHISTYGKGGWHEAATLADRDNIPAARRFAGMACMVASTQLFILGTDLATWTLFTGSGIPDAPVDGQAYIRQDAAWVDANTVLDGGIFA